MAVSPSCWWPAACAAGETCGLHIALHGCEQPEEKIGDAFAHQAGYNRWADTNNIIVLFPQTKTDNTSRQTAALKVT